MNSILSGNVNKAIAAFLVPLIVLGLAHFGFKADPDVQAALVTLLTALAVFLVPNKQEGL